MREIAEMFVPKAMYGAVPVRLLPPTRVLTGLAGGAPPRASASSG